MKLMVSLDLTSKLHLIILKYINLLA